MAKEIVEVYQVVSPEGHTMSCFGIEEVAQTVAWPSCKVVTRSAVKIDDKYFLVEQEPTKVDTNYFSV